MTKRKKSSVTWKSSTHRCAWRDVSLRVKHTRDYISKGWDHVETFVVAPRGAIIPITDTGYLSHFIDAAELKAAGGPVRFVVDWCDREAKIKKWQQADFRNRQGNLFVE